MHLCSLTDELGYTHIRQVEHYFKPYGGYSPNPLDLPHRCRDAHQATPG